MLYYFIRRFIYMVITVAVVSIVAFILIQLPPGDYLTSYVMQLQEEGTQVSKSELASLQKQYGLGEPVYVQYFKWIKNIILHGDFGRSLQWNKPVSELIWERMALTIVMSLFAMIFTYAIAIPVGIYSATHQYSIADHSFTVVGYIGLATPNFLLALILMFMAFKYFGASVGGLFSPQYMRAAWSLGKVLDMFSHLWIPVIVLGTAGTAGLIRVMRGMLLDELRKQYVITARAKGVKELILLFKYPVRVAINPIVSAIGWRLAGIISGAPIVATVLSLPTTGPLMLRALMSQDMYLAGSFILLLCTLTVIGTFISDILLALLDPRIRMGR
jgi:peptide/nickel transport system permease protein